eukprot:TRINITY_DN8629_c0_g1_i1.p1 TRINITY_DN8629_c0_g1~~TRINITY_DN8629_c0_g1_i1.p1  ORF type:complete len:290 (-),score=46.59 TRINITY_DN8629_c0_g1_i1:58-927(-)
MDKDFDIYSIGTEECGGSIAKSILFSSKQEWIDKLNSTLPGHRLVADQTLCATHLAVYVKNSLYYKVAAVETNSVPTGVANAIGNKGGVGVAMTLGQTSMLFVNAHFAAHQTKVAERNADYLRINQNLSLGRAGSRADLALASDRFDCVFWSGDLNYRINGNRGMIDHLLTEHMAEVLRNNDQLTQEMSGGNVFQGFEEGPLSFQPTYKLDFGSNTVYDTSSKARIPAWTDRVLYVPSPNIQLIDYGCDREVVTSDHLPVYALFEVRCDLSCSPELSVDEGASRACVVC